MSRQVLNAVFPLLKAQWLISDARLGSLSGVVALMVGLLAFPLSLLADRRGRVRILVLAAVTWSLATVACALAAGYGQLFLARTFVGIGEAAYGSVGLAVVLTVFPAAMRGTLSGTFVAGGAFGTVLGAAIGGAVGEALGWRWAFGVTGALGLVLASGYGLVVTERRLATGTGPGPGPGEHAPLRALLPELFCRVSIVCAYLGSGLQFIVAGALVAWLPSFFSRYYHLTPAKGGAVAGLFALVIGIGMIGGGIVSDRVGRTDPAMPWTVAMTCGLASCVLLPAAFWLPAGGAQLLLLALGALASAATAGPAGAMVASLTPAAISASAFAVLALANNLLGLLPGSVLTGVLADRLGLAGALRLIPLAAAGAAVAFWIGRGRYAGDLAQSA
jgi:MFS family permease